MSTFGEKIHIAVAAYDLSDEYNKYAGTMLLSLLEHCSLPVCIHILYDNKLSINKEETVNYHKSCYQKITERYNSEIYYHHVEMPNWVNNIGAVKFFTPGTLERLYLPELLPDVDKIIYLDGDMIINTDISFLWNTELNDTLIGACFDRRIKSICDSNRKIKRILNNVGIDISKYFNAGMLVLNLKKLRELDTSLSTTTLTFLQKNPKLPYADQDLLNWFFHGNYTRLDEKYNIYVDREDILQYINDCIIHYAGDNKPWKESHGVVDIPYWESFRKTPWCKNLTIYYKNILSLPNIPLSLHLLEKDFFNYLDGPWLKRVGYTMHFIFGIAKSFVKMVCGITHRQ